MRTKTIFVMAAVCALASSSFAQLIISGVDLGTGPGDARPNSNAAAAAFDTLASSVNSMNTITFERFAHRQTVPFSPFTGVTITGSTWAGDEFFGNGVDISNRDTNELGYNTTPFGSKHLRIWRAAGPGTTEAKFNFANPIMAFGFYVTGLQDNFDGDFVVEFTNNANQLVSYTLPKPPPSSNPDKASTQFWGFIDTVSPGITSVRLLSVTQPNGPGGRDLWGVDDVRFTNCNIVPEPASMTALALGALALVARRRRK